jgi:hypothetical protein
VRSALFLGFRDQWALMFNNDPGARAQAGRGGVEKG